MKLYNTTKKTIRFILKCFCFAKTEGLENLPSEGGYIICTNHRSNMDPVIVGVAMPGFVRFMAKIELFAFKPFGWFITKLGAVPIRRGSSATGAFKAAEEIVQAGGILLIYPQGTRKKKFRIEDGKAGAAKIAHRTGVPIVPVGKRGTRVRIGEPLNIGSDSKEETLKVMRKIEGLL
jgi:1-acyl-sn-glycerol-3-phosphate acyltransferase